MTIPMLGGFAESLAPVSQAIAQLVGQKMHPNRQMEEMMQQAFAKNPELLQQFADLEKRAPGTAEKLGLGRLANIINFVPESDEQQFNKENKDLKKGALKAQLTASKATNEYNTTQMQKYAEYAKDHPEVTYDAWLKKETGSTSLDTKEQKITIAGKEIELNAATREADLVAHLPPVEGQQMIEDVQRLLRGQMTPDMVQRMAAYGSSEVYKSAFNGLVSAGSAKINNEQQDRALGMQERSLQNDSRRLGLEERRVKIAESESASSGNLSDKFKRTEAMQAFQGAGYVGSLEAWTGLLFDPEVQKKAAGLLDGSIKAQNVDDQALLRAAEANRNAQLGRVQKNAAEVGKTILNMTSKIEATDSDSEREFGLRSLNDQLQIRARMGGEKLKAVWVDPWLGAGRVEFQTIDGKPVDRSKVEADLNDPEATTIVQANDPQILSPAAARLLDVVNNSKDPEAQLNAFKLGDDSPGKIISTQVENAYRAKRGGKPVDKKPSGGGR